MTPAQLGTKVGLDAIRSVTPTTSRTGNIIKPGYSFMNYRTVWPDLGPAVWNTLRICGGALIIIVLFAIFQDILPEYSNDCVWKYIPCDNYDEVYNLFLKVINHIKNNYIIQ